MTKEETGKINYGQIIKVSILVLDKWRAIEGISIKRARQSDWSFENIVLSACEKLRGQEGKQIPEEISRL